MITVQKGSSVDVFCDPAGRNLSFSKPSGDANIKLCSVTAPDLEGSYGVHQKGNLFFDDEGAEIPRDRLATYLTEFITKMKDEGNEWGWEFKVSSD
jgi:hypothetical protein